MEVEAACNGALSISTYWHERYLTMYKATSIGSALCALLLLALIACGSDSGNNSDRETVVDGSANNDEPAVDDGANDDEAPAVDGGPVDLSNALFTNLDASCASYANAYFSSVKDVQNGLSFDGDLTITVVGDKCVFATNAIPNHDFNDGGNFATPVSAQSARYEIPMTAVAASNPTPLEMGDDAIFLNGIKLDLLAAACYDVGSEPLGREKIGCGPDQIDNPWRYDPMSPLNEFGTDRNNAHTQPDGTYHYHGNPMAMFVTDCETSATVSPVIGFAADGFPIYGSCFDDNGTVRKAISSYQFKENGGAREAVGSYTTPVGGRGAVVGDAYDGQFRGDYEYVEGAGDLDVCNGMVANGQYGYYVTDAYPWVLGCYTGTPDDSFGLLMGPPGR